MLRTMVCLVMMRLAMMVSDISRILGMSRMMLSVVMRLTVMLFAGLWAVNAVSVFVMAGPISSRLVP